jgi:hypothetical protein
VFGYNGTKVQTWGSGTLSGLPGSVATDTTGNVFVASYSPPGIAVFDWIRGTQSNLKVSPALGPIGLSFGVANRVVYVADGKSASIAIFTCED